MKTLKNEVIERLIEAGLVETVDKSSGVLYQSGLSRLIDDVKPQSESLVREICGLIVERLLLKAENDTVIRKYWIMERKLPEEIAMKLANSELDKSVWSLVVKLERIRPYSNYLFHFTANEYSWKNLISEELEDFNNMNTVLKEYGAKQYKLTDPVPSKESYKIVQALRKRIGEEVDALETEIRHALLKSISNLSDRFVLAKKLHVIVGAGNYCCPDDKYHIYLDSMAELGLSELVVDNRKGEKYEVPSGVEKKILDEFVIKYSHFSSHPEQVEEYFSLQKKVGELKVKIENLKTLVEKKKKKISLINNLNKNGVDIDEIKKKMSWATNLIVSKYLSSKLVVDIDEQLMIVLKHQSDYSGSGGSEYGYMVIAYRQSESNCSQRYFKYRDRHNKSSDDDRYDFDEVSIVSICKDSVLVSLKTNKPRFEISQSFDLPQMEIVPKSVSTEELKEWKKMYEAKKEELLEQSYFKSQMPDYVQFKFYEGQLPAGTTTGKMIPYQRPEIVDEEINESEGGAILMIKSQIDHCAGRGMQFRWTGYTVDLEGNVEEISSDNAYELALRKGTKIRTRILDLKK